MKKTINIITWILAFVVLFIALYVFYTRSKPQVIEVPNQQNSTQVQKVMAPNFKLKNLQGQLVNLSDYRGKVVVLNFWAVWCKYCKIEMPDFNELNKDLEKEDKAVILAINVQESPDYVKDYLESNNFNLKVIFDEDGSIANTYGVQGFPTTFIVNKDGSLYRYISGATNKKTLQRLINEAMANE